MTNIASMIMTLEQAITIMLIVAQEVTQQWDNCHSFSPTWFSTNETPSIGTYNEYNSFMPVYSCITARIKLFPSQSTESLESKPSS